MIVEELVVNQQATIESLKEIIKLEKEMTQVYKDHVTYQKIQITKLLGMVDELVLINKKLTVEK